MVSVYVVVCRGSVTSQNSILALKQRHTCNTKINQNPSKTLAQVCMYIQCEGQCMQSLSVYTVPELVGEEVGGRVGEFF